MWRVTDESACWRAEHCLRAMPMRADVLMRDGDGGSAERGGSGVAGRYGRALRGALSVHQSSCDCKFIQDTHTVCVCVCVCVLR